MNTTIDLKTAKTIEAMNQKINHMDNAVTDFFNKMSDVLERQLGDDEVYAAVIAPEIELTITPLANVRSYLPCFDEADSCYSISEDVPLALCYDPRQVITLAGKRYLSGAVVFVRYDTNGSFVALTTSDLYLIQCYLAENSVPLMAGREKIQVIPKIPYGSSAGGCSRRCKRAALPAVSKSSCAEQSAPCSRQAHKRRFT